MRIPAWMNTSLSIAIVAALCAPPATEAAQAHDQDGHASHTDIPEQRHDDHRGHENQVRPDDDAHDHARERTSVADADETDLRIGAMIYEMSCTYCHGTRGRGDGGAAIFLGPYSHPRPNDFATGTIKFRSTRSGRPPLLTDLMRTVRDGIPGFMPSYRNLGDDDVFRVAAYVASAFIGTPLAESSDLHLPDYPGPASMTPASIRHGRQLYDELGCAGCHGRDGKGAAVHLRDKRGLMIMPMDLTRPGMFGGGRSPRDLYRTLMTGLDGTPMPGYAEAFDSREDAAWDLVHYILSLDAR